MKFISTEVEIFRTRVLKGLKWIFSILTLPSNLSERPSMTFLAKKVCTCGVWIAKTDANRNAATATTVNHNIFSVRLIMP